jgi:hypothetical protein
MNKYYKLFLFKISYYRKFFGILEHKVMLSSLIILGMVICLVAITLLENSPNISSVFINIGSGLIVSTFFFILVVEFPRFKKLKNRNELIRMEFNSILLPLGGFFTHLIRLSCNSNFTKCEGVSLSDTEISKIFNLGIDQYSNIGDLTVGQYIDKNIKELYDGVEHFIVILSDQMDQTLIDYLIDFKYNISEKYWTNPMKISSFNRLLPPEAKNLYQYRDNILELFSWYKSLLQHSEKYYNEPPKWFISRTKNQ